MSIKDMFLIANQLRDHSNGLNNIKDYLKVENALNQNWQDALTFNKNVAAINAANAKKAYDDILGLEKAQGERAALGEYARNLYDPNTLSYRSEEVAHQIAAPVAAQTNNPYAMVANHNAHRAAALQKANAIAAIDPAQALALNNQAWGGAGISAKQNADGTLRVTNSQGYTRTIADPNLAAMYGADSLKTSSTLADWKHQDQVSTRDYMEQLGLNADQAQHNRTNNELSLRLQHQLNQETNRENAALKWDYAVKEHEWKKANGLYDEKSSKQANFDMKQYTEIRNSAFRELLAQGQDWVQAANNAEIYANDMFGLSKTAQSDPNPNNKAADIFAQTKPQAQNTTQTSTTPQELGSSTFAGTRFGSYEIPRPAETRQAEIDQLTTYIAQMQAKHQHNAQINPNAYITQQQAEAIKDAQRQLDWAKSVDDVGYYKARNPIAASWNNLIYGNPMPNPNIKR